MEQLGVYKDGDDVTLRFSRCDERYLSQLLCERRQRKYRQCPASMSLSLMGRCSSLSLSLGRLTFGERERDLRRVTLSVDAGGAFITKEQQYIVLRSFELSVPKQSFISIGEAQLQAIDMLNGGSLLTGGEGDLRRQLIEATKRIKSMSFSIRRIHGMDWDDYDRPQNMLSDVDSAFPLGWSVHLRHC